MTYEMMVQIMFVRKTMSLSVIFAGGKDSYPSPYDYGDQLYRDVSRMMQRPPDGGRGLAHIVGHSNHACNVRSNWGNGREGVGWCHFFFHQFKL